MAIMQVRKLDIVIPDLHLVGNLAKKLDQLWTLVSWTPACIPVSCAKEYQLRRRLLDDNSRHRVAIPSPHLLLSESRAKELLRQGCKLVVGVRTLVLEVQRHVQRIVEKSQVVDVQPVPPLRQLHIGGGEPLRPSPSSNVITRSIFDPVCVVDSGGTLVHAVHGKGVLPGVPDMYVTRELCKEGFPRPCRGPVPLHREARRWHVAIDGADLGVLRELRHAICCEASRCIGQRLVCIEL
mmetsp:Transcript_93447/g.263831  ORF Transcript_93447/g.263831 Transcript_93447/m.263831 type:complete len:238 (+) Transcript_93447:250-963(+)